MTRSAFSSRPRRRGFTLIEVALAIVAGSMLLTSLVYTSNELRRASEAVFNESMLQTVARDLENDLEMNLHQQLSRVSNSTADQPIAFSNNASAQLMDFYAANGGTSVYKLRFVDSPDGGRLERSTNNGVSWQPIMTLGSRGMLSNTEFKYSNWTNANNNLPANTAVFGLDPRVQLSLVRVNSLLHKGDMVPFYHQSVSSPRALTWSWVDDSRAGSPPGSGGTLAPVAVDMSSIDFDDPFNLFANAGAGNFGWLAWQANNVDGNTGATADNITSTDDNSYINPFDKDDHSVDENDWVWGNTGNNFPVQIETAINDTWMGQEVIMIVYDNVVGVGGNFKYQIAGFAKFRVNNWVDNANLAIEFVGWVDKDGNPVDPPANAGATPTPAPTATPTASPTASPSATPTASPSATPTASPTAAPPSSSSLMPLAIYTGAATGSKTYGTTTASNFVWLGWRAGETGEANLRTSLGGANSGRYINPADATDTHIDVNDQIWAIGDISNADANKDAVDLLLGAGEVTVPVFNAAADGKVTVSGFARIDVTSKSLSSPDTLGITFVRLCDSAGN